MYFWVLFYVIFLGVKVSEIIGRRYFVGIWEVGGRSRYFSGDFLFVVNKMDFRNVYF